MRLKVATTKANSVLLRCLALAAGVSFDVAGQTSGAQADVDKIQQLIAEYANAVDAADVMLVREIWSNSSAGDSRCVDWSEEKSQEVRGL